MRDDFEFNSLFCQMIEQHSELYDFTRVEYSNKCIQESTWQFIANELKQTVNDCKERWRNIRARYGKTLKARESNSSTKFIKEYYLAPQLKFLDYFINFKKTKDKSKTEEKDKYEDKDEEHNHEESSSSIPEKTNCSIPKRKRKAENSKCLTDPDLAFLKSLLPDMKAMTNVQKRRFKIGVLSLAGDVLGETSNPANDKLHEFNVSTDPIVKFEIEEPLEEYM